MEMPSSGLQYAGRFFAAASYAGFDGSPKSSYEALSSKFSDEAAFLLSGLYQQATVGPCNIPDSSSWGAVERRKWKSWNGLNNMSSAEAMRLFIKILEGEDPSWYSRASNTVFEPVASNTFSSNVDRVMENEISIPDTRTITSESGTLPESQDKDVSMEGLGRVSVYDQWIVPSVSGQLPRARYKHGAAVVQDKMYIFGGNYNGHYLNDLHVLDLRSWKWSKVESDDRAESLESPSASKSRSCSGHSLVLWQNKLLSIGGHTKDPFETIQVKVFDLQTSTWSTLKTTGKLPVSRGGHTATLVGKCLVLFGGEDVKRTLLNDLHVLDLETMTWDEIHTVGDCPPPRADHVAAVHMERFLLIFGGVSHASCLNDLHLLDLKAMEWSRPKPLGYIPTPRAGHAGMTIGEDWFIVGGGNSKGGASETVVLNMPALAWSVVTGGNRDVPVASEGLSLVRSFYNGEDILITFGGYNGRYSNGVNILKPTQKSKLQPDVVEAHANGVSTPHDVTNLSTNVMKESEEVKGGKIREIVIDSIMLEPMRGNGEQSKEHVIATLKAGRDELQSSLSMEKMISLQLKQDLAEAETRNADLYKELQSVRGQLAAEQSRCFKLEVDVAELRQKLQTMESLEKEVELVRRQNAASEEALNARPGQSPQRVWSWLAGSPSIQKRNDS